VAVEATEAQDVTKVAHQEEETVATEAMETETTEETATEEATDMVATTPSLQAATEEILRATLVDGATEATPDGTTSLKEASTSMTTSTPTPDIKAPMLALRSSLTRMFSLHSKDQPSTTLTPLQLNPNPNKSQTPSLFQTLTMQSLSKTS